MAVLHIVLYLHGHEDERGAVPVHHEIGGVRQQLVVMTDIELRRGFARLSHGEPDERAVGGESLSVEQTGAVRSGVEQQRRVRGHMDLAPYSDLLQQVSAPAVAHRG